MGGESAAVLGGTPRSGVPEAVGPNCSALSPPSQAFLPLACTANLMKNLAAVAASSTRAPIYRTFALSNNLADVTAKVGGSLGFVARRCQAYLAHL